MRSTAILSFLIVGLSSVSQAAPSRGGSQSMNAGGQSLGLEERHFPWGDDEEEEEDHGGPGIRRHLPWLGDDDQDDENNRTRLHHWPFPGENEEEGGNVGLHHLWPWMGDDEQETGPSN
ncbi:hypothetical protein BDV59DRAFT_63271 [Aspergillus ambiguus]|uniref:uncharacterized protein n=1 Tax=Aspergillus ambiguus TaxID=176160 RepID=UPI003CCDB80F